MAFSASQRAAATLPSGIGDSPQLSRLQVQRIRVPAVGPRSGLLRSCRFEFWCIALLLASVVASEKCRCRLVSFRVSVLTNCLMISFSIHILTINAKYILFIINTFSSFRVEHRCTERLQVNDRRNLRESKASLESRIQN